MLSRACNKATLIIEGLRDAERIVRLVAKMNKHKITRHSKNWDLCLWMSAVKENPTLPFERTQLKWYPPKSLPSARQIRNELAKTWMPEVRGTVNVKVRRQVDRCEFRHTLPTLSFNLAECHIKTGHTRLCGHFNKVLFFLGGAGLRPALTRQQCQQSLG